MIRVILPAHLRTLAQISGELSLDLTGPQSTHSVLDAIEDRFPTLCGTMRDHQSKKRRPYVRFFACQKDLSHDSPQAVLPSDILLGIEPLLIVGAMSGG